jgi:hypothetical protein
MPNWCTNYVDIKSDDADALLRLYSIIITSREAKDHDEGFFDQLKPCPRELLDDDLTMWGGNDDEAIARQTKRDAMKKRYSFESWYDWRVENWGTKWDIREFGFIEFNLGDCEIKLQFETAWSPPIPIFELLKNQGFTVNAEYVDEGMGFVGDWRDGDDQCFGDKESLPDRLSHLWPEYDEEGELI